MATRAVSRPRYLAGRPPARIPRLVLGVHKGHYDGGHRSVCRRHQLHQHLRCRGCAHKPRPRGAVGCFSMHCAHSTRPRRQLVSLDRVIHSRATRQPSCDRHTKGQWNQSWHFAMSHQSAHESIHIKLLCVLRLIPQLLQTSKHSCCSLGLLPLPLFRSSRGRSILGLH